MSALLEVAKFDSFTEIEVEEFDLERLATLSEPEAPSAPRFRMRASLVALLLATMVVSALATLPAPAMALARACAIGN